MIPDFGESDVLHLNLPLKQILSTSLKNNTWPLWTPYLAGGFPILAEGQMGAFYLPNLVLFRFLPLIPAYNLNLIISFALAYLGIYLFGRSLKFSRISSSFAATIFTFSSFLSVHLNHFNLIQAASLLPILFWSSLLLWRKPNLPFAILFAFFFSQQIFTGHFYIVFITFAGISIYLIGLLIFSSSCKLEGGKKIFYFGLSLVFAFLLSAIQLFPTIELWRLSGRAGGLDFATITAYPYPPKHLLTFINPYAFGSPADGTYPAFASNWGIFWENTAYIGLLPLILTGISFFFYKEKLVKIFGIITLVSILLVLGKYSPLYLVFSFPPFNFFRVPSKFLLLTTFSLSILSGYSLERLIKWLQKLQITQKDAAAFFCVKRKILCYSLVYLLFPLVIIDEYRFSYNYPPATPTQWWIETTQTTQFLKEKEGRITSIGAPLAWNSIFLKQGWIDMKPYEYFRNSLYPNYNTLFSVPTIDLNTGGLIPKRYSFFASTLKEIDFDEEKKVATLSAATQNALSLAAVKYLISPYKIISSKLEVVYRASSPEKYNLSPFYVYQNRQALPRAYIAFQRETVSTVEEWYRKLKDIDLSNEKKVLVENDQSISFNNRGEGSVKIISEDSTQITLQTLSDTDGILVLTDTNYPGWQATIDGKLAKIETVNLIQRGVKIEKGTHTIVFSFHSSSFDFGKKITILSFFITFLAMFLSHVLFPRKASGNMLPFWNP